MFLTSFFFLGGGRLGLVVGCKLQDCQDNAIIFHMNIFLLNMDSDLHKVFFNILSKTDI